MSLLPLGLERGSCVAVEADLAQISDKFKDILKNILIVYQKINEGLTGLERSKGE